MKEIQGLLNYQKREDVLINVMAYSYPVQMFILIGTVSEVSDVAHGPLLLFIISHYLTGNGLLPCELDPNVKENGLSLMKQEEDVSTENNEPILIKKEPEWEDQERGEGVHGEITQDSSHGSCTKDLGEKSHKTPERNTCTENENDPLEPSKNTDESDKELLESSNSTSSSDNDEELWEPPKYMTKAKQNLLRPSNKQQYQKGKYYR